jgi:hypothetical protein
MTTVGSPSQTRGPTCATIARMRTWRTTLTVGLLLAAAVPARAQTTYEPLYTPSIFSYGFHGFLLGGAAGLGGGYLAGRSGGWHDDDWRALGYGAGVGALVGGALGLGLGIADMTSQTPGRGVFVLRDGGYGMVFGAATGTIAGGLAALSTDRKENLLLGASIGALAGTGVGLVLGSIEGQRWRGRAVSSAASPWVALVAARDAGGGTAWLPALGGRY